MKSEQEIESQPTVFKVTKVNPKENGILANFERHQLRQMMTEQYFISRLPRMIKNGFFIMLYRIFNKNKGPSPPS